MPDPFQLLADPTRRRLIELTSEGERSVTELVEATGLTQPAVSKQLATLRKGGLVEVRKEGRYRFYRARPEELQAMRAWLRTVGAAWNDRLDALERHLDEDVEP